MGFYKEVGHDFSCGESFAKRVDDFIIHSIFAACFVFLKQFAELWTSIGDKMIHRSVLSIAL